MKKIEILLEKTIFASRWILAPFYLGLSLSLLVLLYEFGREIIHFFKIIHETDIAGVLLFILSLVDISLAANLLIIVIFSGYENFVSKIHIKDHEDKPEWMGHVDFTDLKIKNFSTYYDPDYVLANKIGLRGLPTTLIVNRNGKEIARVIGSIDFADEKFISWLRNL